MVDLPKSVTGSKRIRKFFAKNDDAVAYLSRVKRLGFDGADLRTGPGAVTIADLCEMWMQHKAGLKGASMAQIRMVCKNLTEAKGKMDSAQFTHREADAWIKSIEGGPTHKRNFHRVAKRMFDWAANWAEIIPRNPFIKVEVPQGDRKEIQVLRPEMFRKMLKSANGLPDNERGPLLAYLALGAFAGLRTCEIERAKWDDIGDTEIYVSQPKRTKRGLRPRFVEVLPALSAVLTIVPREGERVLPWNPKNFRLHRKSLMDALKLKEWPDNCLRHSYRTYHVGFFQNIEKTRLQMGHGTSDMTAYQYGGIDRRSVAKEWWDAKKVKLALQ